jgi:hypothetical protein
MAEGSLVLISDLLVIASIAPAAVTPDAERE